MAKAAAKAAAKKIKVILFDVDGVLTDGTIWFVPGASGSAQATRAEREKMADAGGYAIASDDYAETKGFNAHDGTGITLARMGGLKTGVVTKRLSEAVRLRARDLKLDFVIQGCADKAEAIEQVGKEAGVKASEIAFVGDDIIDLPAMRKCGLAIAVASAREEVKDESDVVTDRRGGDGAARDAIEYVLRAQGKWESVVRDYLGRKR